MTGFCILCGTPHCERHPESCDLIGLEIPRDELPNDDADDWEDDPDRPDDS